MRPECTEKRMTRFIQGDRPEAGAELAMTGWKLARLFLGVASVAIYSTHSNQCRNLMLDSGSIVHNILQRQQSVSSAPVVLETAPPPLSGRPDVVLALQPLKRHCSRASGPARLPGVQGTAENRPRIFVRDRSRCLYRSPLSPAGGPRGIHPYDPFVIEFSEQRPWP